MLKLPNSNVRLYALHVGSALRRDRIGPVRNSPIATNARIAAPINITITAGFTCRSAFFLVLPCRAPPEL